MWKLLLLLSTLCSSLLPSGAVPIQLHGLNYNTRQGPDWDWDKCKSDEQIRKELTLLSRVTNRIRILSLTDCYQAAAVLPVVKELGMQMWLGIWVGTDENVFDWELSELKNLISQGLVDEDTVLGVSVGSEAIYREDTTVDQMVDNLNEVYAALLDVGMDIPVAIVDVAPEYSASAKLRSAVNVTMTNTFPFWEGIDIDGAVADLQEDLEWLLQLPESSGKPFILAETGWPSDGYIEGVGVAGPDLQRQFFAECFCFLEVEKGWDYYWFTGIDNAWRQEQDPDNTIEGNWGLLYSDLTLKEHFQDFSFECSNGVEYSFAGVDWSIPGDVSAPVAAPTSTSTSSPTMAALPTLAPQSPTAAPVSPTVPVAAPTSEPTSGTSTTTSGPTPTTPTSTSTPSPTMEEDGGDTTDVPLGSPTTQEELATSSPTTTTTTSEQEDVVSSVNAGDDSSGVRSQNGSTIMAMMMWGLCSLAVLMPLQ
eukprot:Nitzschia sp. Nitz4//scaffold370_size15137//12376//13898//NITZ4_008897-RA/size15137-snap-gene-0.29-mRNA-1//-1//CDS//3329549580//4092//frame0